MKHPSPPRVRAAMVLSALAGGFLGGCAPGPAMISVSPSHQFAPRTRLAVLDLDWSPPTGKVQAGSSMVNAPNAGRFVADSLSSRLLEIRNFDVLERTRLAQLLAEKSLSQTDLVKQGRYNEIGQFLGVDYLVLGTVNSFTSWTNGFLCGYVISFNCRCVDVRTSQVVWAMEGKHEGGPTGPLDPATGLQTILDDGMPKLRRSVETQTKR
ncbi:MAG: CsgG/HfaB family protein [Planctomycetaceae bacterium]|nr:CsgG/HfaB family protein [Planctomycetaceae bacterium]